MRGDVAKIVAIGVEVAKIINGVCRSESPPVPVCTETQESMFTNWYNEEQRGDTTGSRGDTSETRGALAPKGPTTCPPRLSSTSIDKLTTTLMKTTTPPPTHASAVTNKP